MKALEERSKGWQSAVSAGLLLFFAILGVMHSHAPFRASVRASDLDAGDSIGRGAPGCTTCALCHPQTLPTDGRSAAQKRDTDSTPIDEAIGVARGDRPTSPSDPRAPPASV